MISQKRGLTMGISYQKRPRLEDLESKTVKQFDAQAYALAESGQTGYVEKVDIDTILETVDDRLDAINERLKDD